MNIAKRLAEALRACSAEIRRLHDVHGERYAGKIGEPELEVADNARAALAAYDAEQGGPALAGPWRVEFDTDTRGIPGYRIRAPEVSLIAWLPYGDKELASANARRIVACVNACEGLSTAALETAGERPVRKLIDAACETVNYDEEQDAGEGRLFEAVRALDEDPA